MMSQRYQNSKSGKAAASAASAGDAPRDGDSAYGDAEPPKTTSANPAYMTVGSGSSRHAAELQALLSNDSGYGGSMNGDGPSTFDFGASAVGADMPIVSPAYRDGDSYDADAHRRMQAAATHQLWYNQQRVSLGRSITRVVELLKGLQDMNVTWPAHYPSVQRADSASTAGSPPASRAGSRPAFSHTQSIAGEYARPASPASSAFSPAPLRRSLTATADRAEAESSKSGERRVANAEPRLVTPQIAQEFSILKLDLKLGSLHQAELVHSLEKSSVASLLDGKISSSIRHLSALRERIEDTASKVLITGDLNAGKSTFCNALLRRKILPEDQQPCTAIFCEVLDARENSGVEEVHAIRTEARAPYNRNDESTYDSYKLTELEQIVHDNEKYLQCKVYVKDVRTVDESLLNNGVVDIALIDAPGLNMDTTKTTAIFARQEEIDVVVFVVSAANHFTMTAQEFIWAAAAEKAYLFIVVNGFDNIRDKARCEKTILKQIQGMSPRTFKESSELVHFVSSNAIPTSGPPGGPPGGSGSGSSSAGGGGGDGPDKDPKGKGKETDKDKLQDFEKLEQSLRRFVLEKRARSKLAPAKTYLLNILNDVHVLATINSEVAQSEVDRVTHELAELGPALESSSRAKKDVSEEVDRAVDEACTEIYDGARASITTAIARAGADGCRDLVVYPGLFSAFEYADDLKAAMLARVADAVARAENAARDRTARGVNVVRQMGLLHVGDDYGQGVVFRPDLMYGRRKDLVARQVAVPTEFADFFDLSVLSQGQEKVVGGGMALTVATAVGTRMIGFGGGWMDHTLSLVRVLGSPNMRKLIVPGIVVAAVSVAAYLVHQIPKTLPNRLSAKLAARLAAQDYVHANATRVADHARRVLRIPADELRVGLARSVDKLGAQRDEALVARQEALAAGRYFGTLGRESAAQRDAVAHVDLEAPPPGTAAA